jgi:type I restriction enzyme M protein
VLFIDARKMGFLVDKVRRELRQEDILKIASTYHAWRGENANKYEDVAGYCSSVKLKEIEENGYVITPGRYVGSEDIEDDDETFAAIMQKLTSELIEQNIQSAELDKVIKKSLQALGYDI